MTSGPQIHIFAKSNTLIGDPPLRSLRFVRLFDDIDGAELSRQGIRPATRQVSTVRHGHMSRVVFLFPGRDDVEPHRIEVDSRIVRSSEARSYGWTIRPIPRPRIAPDKRPES
jgi:hypothetical protein